MAASCRRRSSTDASSGSTTQRPAAARAFFVARSRFCSRRARPTGASLQCNNAAMLSTSREEAVNMRPPKNCRKKEDYHEQCRSQDHSGNRRAGAGGAAAQQRGRRRRPARSRSFRLRTTTIPIVGETECFRSGGSIASAATTPRMRARWAPIRTASRRSSSRSRPTRSRTSRSARSRDHPYPSLTKNYHYEVELVAALKSGGTNISVEQALDHVYGYARRPRHDPARSAARDGRREEAVGDRQEF